MPSSLSLAVGYNSIVPHGRRPCNNVVATLAREKTPTLFSRRRTPASILSSAALGPWCGPSLCALEALRKVSGGASMTTPGGARTTTYSYNSPRARRTGFYHGVGVSSVYLAPALRFAPSRCPKPSLTPTPAKVATWYTKIRLLGYVLRSASVLQSG
jgi:hypothetical protein